MIFSKAYELYKNFSLEIVFINRVRSFKDGVTFFDLKCNLDLYVGDHKPALEFLLEVCNYQLIAFTIYNINHVKEDGQV